MFLGVGSDEVLDLLFRITCRPGDTENVGDQVIVTPPTYGMYTVCAKVNDVGIVTVPLNTLDGEFTPDYDKVCLSSTTSAHELILFEDLRVMFNLCTTDYGCRI